jgi:hypothetical protein
LVITTNEIVQEVFFIVAFTSDSVFGKPPRDRLLVLKLICIDAMPSSVTRLQGDQIGPIFGDWAIVFFGHFLKKKPKYFVCLLLHTEKVTY